MMRTGRAKFLAPVAFAAVLAFSALAQASPIIGTVTDNGATFTLEYLGSPIADRYAFDYTLDFGAFTASQENTFSRDVRDDKLLQKTLREMSAEVAKQLRKNNLAGKTIKLKIRWPDFITMTRQITLNNPTDQEAEIANAVLELMKVVRKPNQAVRLIA